MMADELFSKRLAVTFKTQGREDRRSHVQVTVELHNVLSPAPRKELVVRLTDEKDLFFLYTLRLAEEDFQSLKVQQGLLVDFGAFPQKFIDLLELCLQEENKELPKFILDFVANGTSAASTGNLNVIETNPFKHLTHLSLKFLPGTDTDVKKYLADCLKNLKDQNETLLHKFEHTESDLSTQLRQAREALASRTSELDNLKTEWNARTSDLTSRHSQELNVEREKSLQNQTSLQQRYQREKGDLEQAHMKIAKQLEGKIYELETTNKDLTERKYKSEASLRELRSKVTSLEEELQQTKQELSGLRKNNAGLDADYHEQGKLTQQMKTRLAVMEQEIRDKEQLLQKTTDLLNNEKEQKIKTEEDLERKKRQAVKLEASIKTMSDELVKGNEIIKKLQGEIKNYHTKLKLRNQVTTEQEKLLGEKNREMEELRKEHAQLKSDFHSKKAESEKLSSDLEVTMQKLEESRQLLKTNENVINWLNKQVTEVQLSHQRQGHGPFELNSTASSGGTGYKGPAPMHNFSAPSMTGSARLSNSINSGPSVPSVPSQHAVRMPPPRSHGPQVHFQAQKSSIPQPVAKSSPIGGIPEVPRTNAVSPHSSPPHIAHSKPSSIDPFLDSKYLQRADDMPVRAASVPTVQDTATTSLHFTPPAVGGPMNPGRLSKDIIMPRTDVPRATQPPLASAYFPSKANAT